MEDRFKFRVWDKERKKYVQDQFSLLEINQGYNIQIKEKLSEEVELALRMTSRERVGDYALVDFSNWYFENLILEQCTGLKDKNKVLAYENDLVKVEGEDTILQIIFRKEYADYVFKVKDENITYPVFMVRDTFEIIGSIHEEKQDGK